MQITGKPSALSSCHSQVVVGPVFKKIEAISDEANRLRTFFVFVAKGIDGEEIATRGVCLDGKRNDQVAFHALADYQNHVIGWLQRE